MNNFKAVVLGIVLWWGGCALAEPPEQSVPWVMSAAADSEHIQPVPGKSRIVVFRLAHPGVHAAPINVFVNDGFHSSLLPENRAWIVTVCPGQADIGVSPVNPQSSLARETWTKGSRNLKAGEITFFQVDVNSNGRGIGRFVDQSRAIGLVRGLPVQSHVITRVPAVADCPAEVVRLNASALFRFDRSDLPGMTNNGEKVIRDVARRISREYASVDRVVVKGYSDPIGEFNYNVRLSEKRADTVASILTEGGLKRSQVDSRGFGPRNLLVSDCDRRSRSNADALIACNQPNRRVEVEIYGIKASR